MAIFGGNLYQFKAYEGCTVGHLVKVNGPYDTYGVVREIKDGTALIRGVRDTGFPIMWHY